MIFYQFAQDIVDIDSINVPKNEANEATIASVISYIFAIIGGLSVLMVIIGGIRYIVSAGDPQRISTAKNTILYAIIGLVVSVSAYIIVRFIVNAIDAPPDGAFLRSMGVFL